MRWLYWDLTLVRAYENLDGVGQLTYGWENGVKRYNFSVAPDGRDPLRVWMIYYDGISRKHLAHYDVLRRLPELVLERNAASPSSTGDSRVIGTSLGDAMMAHDAASGAGFAAQQAVPPWEFVSRVSLQITGVPGIGPCVAFDPILRKTDVCGGIQVRVPDGFNGGSASSIGIVIREGTELVDAAVTVSIRLLSGSTSSCDVPLSRLLVAARRTWGDMHVPSDLRKFVTLAAIPAGHIDNQGHLHLIGRSTKSKKHLLLHMTTGIFYDAISHGVVGLVVSDVSHYGCRTAECSSESWNLSEH